MNNVECLILSSTIDYSTDLVCIELERLGVNYLRINRDAFKDIKVEYSLSSGELQIKISDQEYLICPESLCSIYFRAPIFLRNTGKILSVEEQAYRTQWNSFLRNLIVFSSAKWINNPVATYRAENKVFQLQTAKRCGLLVPHTSIANHADAVDESKEYIVKSLDTALFYENGQEMFVYSEKIKGIDLKNSELQLAPVIIQEFLKNKIDVRVTVVSDVIFATTITNKGASIDGDWRKIYKDILTYKSIELPSETKSAIINLMKELQLEFAGVDLAIVDDRYYFIEINPTGEWGWLSDTTDSSIDKAIAKSLTGK